MKITIISFSGRANGNCQKIAYKVSEEFSNENVAFYDFSSFYIHPCGACKLECFHQGENCLFLEDQEYAMLESVSNTNKENFVSAFQNHLKNGAIPDILFLSARKYHQSSLAGELMDSADAREDLIDFLSR